MTRLIDADALLKYKSDHETISTHLIYNAPTVDAVPISFVEEMKAWAEENGFDMYVNDLNYLLSVWAERKEE